LHDNRPKRTLKKNMLLNTCKNRRGSPNPPMIPEAEVLHFLDMIDARMFAIYEVLSKANGEFTEPIRAMEGRWLYVGMR